LDSESASRMLARVVHRGPDDEGRIEVAGNMLGLSIVDVEGASSRSLEVSVTEEEFRRVLRTYARSG
jgi:asparagine synthetase B (glutamine-hydrolysing)